jgi:hypothetical protein
VILLAVGVARAGRPALRVIGQRDEIVTIALFGPGRRIPVVGTIPGRAGSFRTCY